jgi:hypothetical protein
LWRSIKVKISVIMIDGGFRENAFGARYFANQDFPKDQYEVLWVEHFDTLHEDVRSQPGVKAVCLHQAGGYHSGTCFNHGIEMAQGEVLVIPDADQIVPPDFLTRVWEKHQEYECMVVYGYRLDQISHQAIEDVADIKSIEGDFELTNPTNFGGCLTVRKRWMIELNGYEQHASFGTGAHAQGRDLYTRFKNKGLAVCWEPSLKLYHPWHTGTLTLSPWHQLQLKIIEWRHRTLHYMAFEGIDSSMNSRMPLQMESEVCTEIKRMRAMQPNEFPHIL